MKLFGYIEVSGIKKIVFYNTGEAWIRNDIEGGEPVWAPEGDDSRCRKHQDMVGVVHRKMESPDIYRIWTHGETMNIDMRE